MMRVGPNASISSDEKRSTNRDRPASAAWACAAAPGLGQSGRSATNIHWRRASRAHEPSGSPGVKGFAGA